MASLKEMLASKRAEIAQKSGGFMVTVKPKMGKTRYRLLPSWRGGEDQEFYHGFGQHFIKDKDEKLKAVYVCIEKTFSRPCPLCEAISDGISLASSDIDKGILKQSMASQRILLNALVVDVDRDTPVILEISSGTIDKILSIMEDNLDPDDESFNPLTDLDKGFDIVIERQGTGLSTKYDVNACIKGNKPVPKSVMEKIHDLDKVVAVEHEVGQLKASKAVRDTIAGMVGSSGTGKRLPVIVEEEDDTPFYTSSGTPASVKDSDISMEELDALLDAELGD